MQIKVISYGRRGRVDTAEIVVISDKRSQTLHLVRHGNEWVSSFGTSFKL